jgi:hypothetical protein
MPGKSKAIANRFLFWNAWAREKGVFSVACVYNRNPTDHNSERPFHRARSAASTMSPENIRWGTPSTSSIIILKFHALAAILNGYLLNPEPSPLTPGPSSDSRRYCWHRFHGHDSWLISGTTQNTRQTRHFTGLA